MLNIVLIWTSFILWAVHFALRVNKQIHMFQLNSYRSERYIKWMGKNLGKVMPLREFVPIILFLLLYFFSVPTAYILWMAAYLVMIVWRAQEIEKKKLVYTSRVKRLIATIGVLTALVLLLYCTIPQMIVVPFLFLLALAPFFIMLLAHLINTPIENGMKRRFYNDAKRRIQEAGSLLVIGITGSYGKTSVKHFLHTVLSQQFNVLMTPESYNTPMGVTLTIRNRLKPTHDIFIAEMGAKQPGDIEELVQLAQPKFGVVTSVGEQHLETFKSLDNIKKTKFEMLEGLPPEGVFFTNIDDVNVASYLSGLHPSCKVVTYGRSKQEAAYQASDIQVTMRGTSFTVNDPNGQQAVYETALLGEHNIYNVTACIAIASELGVPKEKIAAGVKRIKPVQHRLELKKLDSSIRIIDDSFNSNPVGSAAALDVLGQMEGQKVIITPGMIELGEKEYDLNHAFGLHAAKVCDYIMLVGEKQTRPIQDALREAGYPSEQLYVAQHLQEALARLRQIASDQTIVLLENDLPDNYNE